MEGSVEKFHRDEPLAAQPSPPPELDPEVEEEAVPWLGDAGTKMAAAALVACVVGGAIAGGIYLSDEWHIARRVAGGAVAGFGSWLLVMVGRVIA